MRIMRLMQAMDCKTVSKAKKKVIKFSIIRIINVNSLPEER